MLRLGLVQTTLFWERPEENLLHIQEKIFSITESCDVIVLPEMFSTGFSMRCAELATESHTEQCLSSMINWARVKDAAITGSLMVHDAEGYKNRLFWVEPDGKVLFYDKKHLFSIGKEAQHYTAGNERLICHFRGWNIMPLICYDLRFPVWCRNSLTETGQALFDLQIFVANWPSIRSAAWKKLLAARAIENQCFVTGVNRVGQDGNGIAHSGDSVVHDFMGETLVSSPEYLEQVLCCSLDKTTLGAFREQFPVLKDADPFRFQ